MSSGLGITQQARPACFLRDETRSRRTDSVAHRMLQQLRHPDKCQAQSQYTKISIEVIIYMLPLVRKLEGYLGSWEPLIPTYLMMLIKLCSLQTAIQLITFQKTNRPPPQNGKKKEGKRIVSEVKHEL